MSRSKGYKILSIEGKDLYGAMNPKNPQNMIAGYKVKNSEGVLNYKKFTNVLDWSLDEMKLEEIYYKVNRRKGFGWRYRGQNYTQQIINVTFEYSYKEFNKAGANTYVRAGWAFRDCEIKNGVYVKDGKLIAIQTNVSVDEAVSDEVLGGYFKYNGSYYEQIGQIPTLMSKSEVRGYLYENGFECDGIEYVRYKRSAGSSRVGKCLFINKQLAEKMEKWDKCGLNIKEGDKIDLASYEAYTALPMSSIISTIELEPKNFLVIDDWESVFKDEVVAVEVNDGHLVADQKEMEVNNSIWDGESLMDASIYKENGYEDKGMLLLRNRFFKTCAFNTNIQQYFKDEGITSVEQLNGFTLAENIEDIKIITTPSSIKYAKFGKIEDWLTNVTSTFGVVKYEKETHYFQGRMVQAHYQLFNTIQLTYKEMEEVLRPSLEYVKALRSDPDVLRYHIKYPFEDEEEINSLKSKNEIIFKMLGINNKFTKTKLYKEFRDDLVRSYIKNLKRGHILLNGNYSTLLGNGLEMLMSSVGKFNGEGVLQPAQIHSKRFEYGKTIMGSRSPHPCVANILLTTNVANEEIDKYFNLTNEIVYINAINENIQQKLNG